MKYHHRADQQEQPKENPEVPGGAEEAAKPPPEGGGGDPGRPEKAGEESAGANGQPAPEEEPRPSAEEEAKRYRELAMRAQADFDNYRKRMAREKEESIRYANASMLEKLLPVLDSFDLGLQAARKSPEAVAIAKGFEMVERQLRDFLRDCGVETVDAEGKDFDPNLHEAVSQQHHPEVPEGKVLHQIRKGYKLKDRLLRPATVIVSRGKALEGVTA